MERLGRYMAHLGRAFRGFWCLRGSRAGFFCGGGFGGLDGLANAMFRFCGFRLGKMLGMFYSWSLGLGYTMINDLVGFV